MREDVLSLPALAGDRVSQEYLKADLYRRAESLRDLPDAPLFFGRLDYAAGAAAPDTGPGDREATDGAWHLSADGFHIGRRHVHDPDGHPVVIDWRAPVSRPFYRASQGDPMDLARRRRFGFSGGQLTAFEDEIFAAGPQQAVPTGSGPTGSGAVGSGPAGPGTGSQQVPRPLRCRESHARLPHRGPDSPSKGSRRSRPIPPRVASQRVRCDVVRFDVQAFLAPLASLILEMAGHRLLPALVGQAFSLPGT